MLEGLSMEEVDSRTAVFEMDLERARVCQLLMAAVDHLGMESAGHGASTITSEEGFQGRGCTIADYG